VEEVQSLTRAEIIKYTYLKYFPSCKYYRYSIQWDSGNTGPVRCNRQWIESQSVETLLLKIVLIIFLEYAEDFWRGLSGTTRDIQNISLGQTDCTVRARTVLRLDASCNTRYAVKYLCFAPILALC
jgi:hypothetical protein